MKHRDARQATLRQMLDPEATPDAPAADAHGTRVAFDPALFDDPSIPEALETFRVEGLRRHLWRYSSQQSCRNTLARLEDAAWLAAWDDALSTLEGSSVEFHGSELGTFGVRALHHGAAHVLCREAYPLDARIAGGMVQKHLLGRWQALHGGALRDASEAERRRSFETFAGNIDVLTRDECESPARRGDCVVFPGIDHSLLGTGIVKALKGHRASRVLPARATIFAMGIEWAYPQSYGPSAAWQLQPMNQLRWSPYPQSLDLGPQFWTALTAPVRVGEIDFGDFHESTWHAALPVVAGGNVDAIVFWFELELGAARLGNAPGSELQCIKPAVQYVDALAVTVGRTLDLSVDVKEHRLHFRTEPRASRLRSYNLPSWYVPMLGDRQRNDAYRTAIASALAAQPSHTVLDIGAGCGLLSMMAAASGAQRVIGCETHPAICAAGREIVALNGFAERIELVNKDCRALKIAGDLGQRADLALFELFDCSLIGEGILHFLAYAREHLLRADARYLPLRGRIRARIVEYRLERIWDIDANLLNPYRFSPAFINVDASRLAHRALTETFELFSFDFATAGPEPQARELKIPARSPGTAGAILFWFDLQLDAATWISNAPESSASLHWKQGLQFLPEVRVTDGMELPLLASHDGSGLRVRWQPDALAKETFSTLPRFDPRWLASAQELEQQTRVLLQHCAANAVEHGKVAGIAQRFAIEPAAHDLDPVIAQRFAAMFL